MPNYYFNFPPITSLTLPQQSALNEPNPIALSGGPGTGKSFVSLWRHISNYQRQNPIESQLLTFTTSLAYYLKASSATQNENAANHVDSTKNWFFNHANSRSEIIVDEAQDMALDFYKSVDQLRRLSPKISYGADNKQILKSSSTNTDGTYNLDVCSPEEELSVIFHNKVFNLDKNFRNTRSILEFAKTVFTKAYIPLAELNSCRQIGEKPQLITTNGNIERQNRTIIDIISQFHTNESHNIGILTPLANTPWTGGEILTARYYFDLIKNHNSTNGTTFDCSYYDWTMNGLNEMKSIHITPFKSAKGLEFDTVIIPCFEYYNQPFRVLNWRDFFVGVTRARSNLFLFSTNDLPLIHSVTEQQTL